MNIAFVSVILRQFCKPFLKDLERYHETPLDKLAAVRNEASDQGNEEVIELCDWIESSELETTFFPATEKSNRKETK